MIYPAKIAKIGCLLANLGKKHSRTYYNYDWIITRNTFLHLFFLGTPISISYPDFLMFFQPLRLTSTRSRAGALGPAWCGLSPCRAYGPRRRQGQDAWSKFVSYVWKIQSLWMEKCSLKQKNDRQRADLGGKSPRAWMITSGRPV